MKTERQHIMLYCRVFGKPEELSMPASYTVVSILTITTTTITPVGV